MPVPMWRSHRRKPNAVPKAGLGNDHDKRDAFFSPLALDATRKMRCAFLDNERQNYLGLMASYFGARIPAEATQAWIIRKRQPWQNFTIDLGHQSFICTMDIYTSGTESRWDIFTKIKSTHSMADCWGGWRTDGCMTATTDQRYSQAEQLAGRRSR